LFDFFDRRSVGFAFMPSFGAPMTFKITHGGREVSISQFTEILRREAMDAGFKARPHPSQHIWLRAPAAEAMALQRPMADGALSIVAKGERQDGVAE
jgi:hypothetical protein